MRKNRFLKFAILLFCCLSLSLGVSLLVDFSKTKNNFIENTNAAIHQKTYQAAVYFSQDGSNTFYKGKFDTNGYSGTLGTITSSIWYTDSNWSGDTHWYCGSTGTTSGRATAEVWGKRDGGALGGPYTTYFSFKFVFTPPEGFERNANGLISVDSLPDSKTYTENLGFTDAYTTTGSSSVSIWTGTKQYDTYYYAVHLKPMAYTITYRNTYNSSNYAIKSVRYYHNYSLPTEPTRTGYTFLGWYTGENGTGTRITSDSVKTSASSQTLYSHWQQNTYDVDVNILSPTGIQDYASGSMTYYNSYSGNTYSGQTDQPENLIHYNGYIRISNISPSKGMYVSSVTNSGGSSKGSISKSGSTYTYTFKYGGTPNEGWDDEIIIQMAWQPYTISLNANYGNKVAEWSYLYNNYITSQITLPSRSYKGYTFNGWRVSSSSGNWNYNEIYNAGTISAGKYGSPTLTGQWTANTYNIELDPDGGSGGLGSTTVTYDQQIPSPVSPLPTRTAYSFGGYYTGQNGTGTQYYDRNGNRTYTSVWKETTGRRLYAYWIPNNYTITYNVNGGNSISSKTYNTLSTDTLALPRRVGYEFINWKVTSSSLTPENWGVNNTYLSGTLLTGKYGSPTLTAEWRAKDWTLIYNANGGEVTPTSKIVTIDTAYRTLPVPTKKGSIFVGWYTALSGGNVVNETTKMTTEGATIYAHWQETWANKTTVTVLRTENNVLKPGVENNPYLISDAEELAYLAKAVENGDNFDNIYFKQTANIDLKKDKNNNTVEYVWLPIGSKASPFSGHYDGQGFVISNIQTSNISNASTGKLRDYQGLFGYTTNAFLQKINLINGAIYGSGDLGGIVGHMSGGKISNCLNGATVTGNANCGLIGYADCVQITSCYNYSAIKGTENVGGIVGYAHSIDETLKTIIRNCYSRCDIVATTSAGGIAGGARANTKISACGFKGNVTASTNKATLVGISATNVEISNSFAIITGTSDMNFNNGSGIATNCISKLSDESHKKYIGTSFENWSVLLDNSGNGQPLPAGFSWLGIGGKKLTESDIINLGYVKS